MTPKEYLEAELYELWNDAEHALSRTDDARVQVRGDDYARLRDSIQGAQRAAENAAAHARWALEHLDDLQRSGDPGGKGHAR